MVKRHFDDPDYPSPDVSELQDQVLGLLEAAGFPTEISDQVVALIAKGEEWLAKQANDMPELDLCLRELDLCAEVCAVVFGDKPYGG